MIKICSLLHYMCYWLDGRTEESAGRGESAAAARQSGRRREGERFASILVNLRFFFSDCNPLFSYMSHSLPGRGGEVPLYLFGVKGWMLQTSA